MIAVRDALGDEIVVATTPRRVVSLIPSVTETLFALGAEERLVGCTTFCIHPAGRLAGIPRVGGTKDPQIEKVRALAPDLILANREENRAVDVQELRGIAPVHVSYPRDLNGLLRYIRELGVLLGARAPASDLVHGILRERGAHAIRRTSRGWKRPPRCVYLIWRRPWMAAGSDTFIDAMLGETGFENAIRGERSRYPEIELDRSMAARADLVLLSSEPFPFAEKHRHEVADLTGLPVSRIQLVSGEAFSWFGCRTRDAFAEAERVLASAAGA